MTEPNQRVAVTADARQLGVSVSIGDVVVSIRGPAPPSLHEQSSAQVRQAALRLAARALEVAQQEIRQERGDEG